ncbi:nucleotidyltransferase domain-containing protein, partial [Dactylosporangium sp. NPDC005572]|uniref:nucleotidyltransferase domain-containing protein n=1 Tax=Dactylosporangium sp. NPDC005572 TaxID=3156889 RepID=UPI0033BF7E30
MDSALAAADRLAHAVAGLIEAPVLTVILHGSLATGDFLPGRSDLDLLVVIGAEDRSAANTYASRSNIVRMIT